MAASLTVTPVIEEHWTGEDTPVAQIERELARLRDKTSQEGSQPNLRTSVMTHIAWVPPRWKGAAEETLAGMAERHPSRTLLLVPMAGAENGLDAQVAIRCFPIGPAARTRLTKRGSACLGHQPRRPPRLFVSVLRRAKSAAVWTARLPTTPRRT